MGSDKHDAQVSGGRKVESPRFARGELVQENFAWGLFGGGWNWREERCRIAKNFCNASLSRPKSRKLAARALMGVRLSPGGKRWADANLSERGSANRKMHVYCWWAFVTRGKGGNGDSQKRMMFDLKVRKDETGILKQ